VSATSGRDRDLARPVVAGDRRRYAAARARRARRTLLPPGRRDCTLQLDLVARARACARTSCCVRRRWRRRGDAWGCRGRVRQSAVVCGAHAECGGVSSGSRPRIDAIRVLDAVGVLLPGRLLRARAAGRLRSADVLKVEDIRARRLRGAGASAVLMCGATLRRGAASSALLAWSLKSVTALDIRIDRQVRGGREVLLRAACASPYVPVSRLPTRRDGAARPRFTSCWREARGRLLCAITGYGRTAPYREPLRP